MIKKLVKYPIGLLQKIENKFIRFLIVGVINTGFGYFLFLFFLWIGFHYSLALLFSQILGILFNYKTTGYIVFENKTNRLIFQFFIVYSIIYLINVGELFLLKRTSIYEFILSQPYLEFIQSLPIDNDKLSNAIGQAIVILPNAIIGFFLNKIFVFRDKQEKI